MEDKDGSSKVHNNYAFLKKVLKKTFGQRSIIGITMFIRNHGPKLDRGIWRIRSNRELYGIYGKTQIIGEIKSSRLRWAGHVERIEENSLIKPGGRRCVGRPSSRWLEDVEEDIREMGVR